MHGNETHFGVIQCPNGFWDGEVFQYNVTFQWYGYSMSRIFAYIFIQVSIMKEYIFNYPLLTEVWFISFIANTKCINIEKSLNCNSLMWLHFCLQAQKREHADQTEVCLEMLLREPYPKLSPNCIELLKDIVRNSQTSAQIHRWEREALWFALNIWTSSPRAYEDASAIMPLPSTRLLQYYKNTIHQKPMTLFQ